MTVLTPGNGLACGTSTFIASAPAGADNAHTNAQPIIVVAYCIKT